MIVRRGATDDREALAAALLSDTTFTADEIDLALALIDGALAASPDYELRVADLDGRAIGYVLFGPTPLTHSTWDLYWIVVDASARGKGVARALMAAMETDIAAHGGGHVRIESSETEIGSRGLYARLAYPEATKLADFYGPGDALFVFYKHIAAAPP